MTTQIDRALAGVWLTQLTFTGGPRKGTDESVTLTFLPSGVVLHADEIPAENGQVPRGIGEWQVQGSRFSYWFNVVLNEPKGRPTIVVYVHGLGELGPDGRTFTASGGSEVYRSDGQLLATNQAKGVATRGEAM